MKIMVPDAADFIWNVVIAMLKKDSNQVKFLDAACGTGNYSLAFLKNGLQHLTMVDASKGMLEAAVRKTEQYKSFVTAKQMVFPELSFPDMSFDAVSFIQVFHHIDHPDESKTCLTEQDYPNMISTLRESYRILKDNGVLVIDLMFDENIESFWWTSLCPIAANRMKRIRIPKAVLIKFLNDINFKNIRLVTHPSGNLQKEQISNEIHRIGEEHWRGYLSQYKHIERSGELPGLIELIEKKHTDGTLNEFRETLNEKFKIFGHHTTVFAQK